VRLQKMNSLYDVIFRRELNQSEKVIDFKPEQRIKNIKTLKSKGYKNRIIRHFCFDVNTGNHFTDLDGKLIDYSPHFTVVFLESNRREDFFSP
jgi:hypothetical protein